MRSHGVGEFPDPTAPGSSSGAGNMVFGTAIPTTINVDAPAFKSAVSTCSRVMFAGASRPAAPPDRDAGQLKYAECLRAHGVPNYPDPAPAGPGPQISGPPPSVDLDSPAAEHAINVCGSP